MIIENTDEAKERYMESHPFKVFSSDNIELTKDDVDALKNGKCIAVLINDGEYCAFISRRP